MLKEILEGWGNNALDTIGLLSPQLKRISEQRLEACHSCPIRNGKWCSDSRYAIATHDFMYDGKQRKHGLEYHGCGCQIVAKSMSYNSECPLGKWPT
jgi:hypothetical protein